jgi:hypothetical protein
MSDKVYHAVILCIMLVYLVAQAALMAHHAGWRAGFKAHREICEKYHR